MFYLKLATYLKNDGSIINPHGSYEANKLVKGESITVVWYIDDPKVSHKDPFGVKKLTQ